MYILGIHPSHNATAALLKDGKIIACVSEERFVRVKNFWGFPSNSVNFLLDFARIKPDDLDLVVVSQCTEIHNLDGKSFDMFNNITSEKKFFFKRFRSHIFYRYPKTTGWLLKLRHYLKYNNYKVNKNISHSRKYISDKLKIEKNKIVFIDHHDSHCYASCFNLPRDKKTLIFSIDGEGDYATSATVNIFNGRDLKRISETKKDASLGFLYALTTFYLGMKPNEHEFKVMGLAPYAKKNDVDKIYPSFKKVLWVDGMKFKSRFSMTYFEYFLNDKMKNVRFDKIASSVQRLTEELFCEWVKNSIIKTNISSISLSGGVAMNVKACQKISELGEMEEIFVMPSAGDESTALGACYYGYSEYCRRKNLNFDPKPLKDLYLGPDYSEEEITLFLNENNYFKKYIIKKMKNIEVEAAKILSRGEIVARLNGRSEFGARALGNRSILSNPSNQESIRVLNELIKDRDFWMPFTPSIIQEDEKRYIFNPEKIDSPYMVITFNSTEKARRDLPAAMHPYDFTIRPQIVFKDWNPSYYKLIKEFKKITGIGAVLNTSFNLHGEPNVLSPKDAIHTFENSGLRYLILGNYLIQKR
ncbi:MAG: carbamoyltransferase C-terminal domain-containing protein [Nanoarchaeota archaeon]